MYVCPVIAGSVEDITILKVLSPFLTRTAKPVGGCEVPIEFNEPLVLFGQKDGLTMQAGIVKIVASAMK